jgi:WD40 repeat protein
VTPDGCHAVSGSNDRTLRIWDLESGQALRTLEGHTDGVSAVEVTPDGRHAVSGSSDQTLRIWDLDGGKEIAAFTGDNQMHSCAVTSDGRTIIAADGLGRLHSLRLVEACLTKPPPAESKLRLLYRKQQPTTLEKPMWGDDTKAPKLSGS